MNRPFKFFTGRSSRKIAEAIASEYNVELGDQNIIEFSDGEFEPSFNESIRGADIFIIQSTMPPGDNLLELLLMIDAARRASAYKINAVIPYFGYARQDKKGKPRVPIGAKLIANLLTTAGADSSTSSEIFSGKAACKSKETNILTTNKVISLYRLFIFFIFLNIYLFFNGISYLCNRFLINISIQGQNSTILHWNNIYHFIFMLPVSNFFNA